MPDVPTDPARLSVPPTRPHRTRHSDVAKRAGVSPATVSKVITGRESDRISEETRRRVLEVVRELNYVPQSAVREMQTGCTGRIGVLLTHPAAFGSMDPYHTAILGGILSAAFEHRRNTLLYTALEPREDTLRQELLGGGADAVIAVGKVWTPLVESVVLQANLPVVYVSVLPPVNDTVRNVPYFAVDCDNEAGGRLAISHLTTLGHTRIGVVVVQPDAVSLPFVQERFVGADAAAHEAGTTVTRIIGEADLERVLQSVAANAPDAPTALFFPEGEPFPADLVAKLPGRGIRVPEDVSLVAFNSTTVCEYAAVPLTAVRQPFTQIGVTAVEIVVDYLNNGITAANRLGTVVRLPVTLDIRASTAAPR